MANYDDRLHSVYAKGRGLDPESLQLWMEEFTRHAPSARPLTVLDLGSGIGRFTPALAETFGGPAYGVEPSARMREVAVATAAHPAVTYLEGAAERISLPNSSCDLALLFLSFHHFQDQLAGLRELARVMKPGGVVLLRSQFADLMPDLFWYRYFPSARRVDADMYLPIEQVRRLAEQAGLVADAEPSWVSTEAPRTLRSSYERVKLRALSTFEHLPETEIKAGFAQFERDAAADPDRELPTYPAAVLTLRHPT